MNHLAIMRQPWFDLVQSGKKPIESRCSINKIPPYEKIHKGDIIYFKESGDFVIYIQANVQKVEYYCDPVMIHKKLDEYKHKIGINDEYILSKAKSRYLTLIWLESVKELKNENGIPATIPFRQKGQLAWISNYDPNRSDW